MDNKLNENRDFDGKESSVNDGENIYGMACTPGESGYNYSTYVGSYVPSEEEPKKEKQKNHLALAASLIITAALLGAVCLLGIVTLDFFLGL